MAHDIFGERFLSRREPAWHKLGKVFDGEMSASEAVVRARVNYQVDLVSCFARFDGKYIEVEDSRVVVREPTHDDRQPRVLGVVSKAYQLIQNEEIAQLLDPISKHWPVETVGALAHGAKMFITFNAGESNIAGEPTRDYFLVVDAKDGSKCLTYHYTPVRVVCQNTLSLALGQATSSMSVRHVGNIRTRVAEALTMMTEMRRTKQLVAEALDALAQRPLPLHQMEQVLQAVYPDPERPGDYVDKQRRLDLIDRTEPDDLESWPEVSTRRMMPRNISDSLLPVPSEKAVAASEKYEKELLAMRENRRNVHELYDRINAKSSRIAGTQYALYNAVVEYADHRRSAESRGFGGAAAQDKKAAQAALFGTRYKEKQMCYKALQSLSS